MARLWQAESGELEGLGEVAVFIMASAAGHGATAWRGESFKLGGNGRPVFWADLKTRTQILQ